MADNKNITNPTEDNKKSEPKVKKPNILVTGCKKLGKFFKDTVGELKKVVWTSKSDLWKSFQLVIAAVVSISVAIAIIDFVSNYVIRAIAGLIG